MLKIYDQIPSELIDGLEYMKNSLDDLRRTPKYQYDYYKYHFDTPPEKAHVDFESLDPARDIPFGETKCLMHIDMPKEGNDLLMDGLHKLYPDSRITQSGRLIYPPGGHLGWHTNSNAPGTRIYITHVEEGDQSFFRCIDNGEKITSYDRQGWTMREFEVGSKPLWHCVYAKIERLSLGFRVQDLSKMLE